MTPELLFICGLFMWLHAGLVDPSYFLLGSVLVVLLQQITAPVPEKREKLTPKNPLRTMDDRQFKKKFCVLKTDIPRLLVCQYFSTSIKWDCFFFLSMFADGVIPLCFSIHFEQGRNCFWYLGQLLFANYLSWCHNVTCQVRY